MQETNDYHDGGAASTKAMTRRRNMQYAEIATVIALLAERFPKTFFVFERRRKPLKLRIHLDLQAALAGAVTPDELDAALRFYCGNVSYLRATLKGAWRYDLDGNPCGTITAEEEAHAVTHIAARTAKAAAKKQSGNDKQPPVAKVSEPKRDGLAALKAAAQRRKGIAVGERHD
jgi:ProP effector